MRDLIRRLEEDGSRHMDVARTILDQLGGGRFKAMTGANSIVAFPSLDDKRPWPGVEVKFPIGSAKYMRIALAPSDTYTVQFMTRTRRVFKEMDDIYADSLRRVVSDTTGLSLRL